jgi:hypothetical protein
MRFLIRHFKLKESFADEICGLVLQSLKRRARLAEIPGRKLSRAANQRRTVAR